MRVRIPFVINPSGKWCASGYPSAQEDPDWSLMMEMADNGSAESDYQCGWIEVDLPLPSVVTVPAKEVTFVPETTR